MTFAQWLYSKARFYSVRFMMDTGCPNTRVGRFAMWAYYMADACRHVAGTVKVDGDYVTIDDAFTRDNVGMPANTREAWLRFVEYIHTPNSPFGGGTSARHINRAAFNAAWRSYQRSKL